MISLIVAAAENGVIGRQGELPWRLSDDLRRFKAITMDKPIVMGRKTWESIGRPLPGRHNIVITRQPGYAAEGCDVVSSVDAAVAASGDADEIMIADVEGDASFALPDAVDWRLVSDERHAADDRNEFDYSFRRYDRVVD